MTEDEIKARVANDTKAIKQQVQAIRDILAAEGPQISDDTLAAVQANLDSLNEAVNPE